MMVDSIAIALVIHPISFIDVTIDVSEFTFAMRSIILPLADVLRAIWPLLFTIAISEATDPLTVIGSTCFESIGISLDPFGMWVVYLVSGHSLTRLFNCEVTRISLFTFHDEGSISARQVAPEYSLEFDNQMNVLFPDID